MWGTMGVGVWVGMRGDDVVWGIRGGGGVAGMLGVTLPLMIKCDMLYVLCSKLPSYFSSYL